MGCIAWCKTTRKLSGPTKRVPREDWITKESAFTPLVDKATFERAQIGLPGLKRWTDRQILTSLQRLLRAKGRLSETIIMNASGVPSTVTLRKRFGGFRNLYDRLGYRMGQEFIHKSGQCERTMKLRKDLAHKIEKLFPSRVRVTNLPTGNHALRPSLLVDDTFVVSLLFARTQHRNNQALWRWNVRPAERNNITLLCKMNSSHDDVTGYYLLPDMRRFKPKYLGYSRFNQGVKFKQLSDFYNSVRKMWIKKTGNSTRPRHSNWAT